MFDIIVIGKVVFIENSAGINGASVDCEECLAVSLLGRVHIGDVVDEVVDLVKLVIQYHVHPPAILQGRLHTHDVGICVETVLVELASVVIVGRECSVCREVHTDDVCFFCDDSAVSAWRAGRSKQLACCLIHFDEF